MDHFFQGLGLLGFFWYVSNFVTTEFCESDLVLGGLFLAPYFHTASHSNEKYLIH